MRILPIIDSARVGGPGKGLIAFIRTARGPGAEVPGVVLFRRRGAERSDLEHALEDSGIRPLLIQEGYPFDLSALRRLGALLRELRPNIVQSHGYKGNVYCLVLRLFGRLPSGSRWVAWVHGWTAENLKVRLYQELEKRAVGGADHIVCVSRSLAQSFRRMKDRLTVVHNAVDDRYAAFSEPELESLRAGLDLSGRRVLLVVGRLSYEKGQDRVLEVAELLKVRHPDAVFLLVGEGPEEGRLRAEIAKRKLEGEVRIVPFQRDVRPYYLLSDVCVLPSRMEGMPNVVLEALAMRRPVVSFDVGGVREIIENSGQGIIVPQADVGAMAEALGRLLSDAAAADAIAEAGHQRVCSGFLNASRTARVLSVYRDVLAG